MDKCQVCMTEVTNILCYSCFHPVCLNCSAGEYCKTCIENGEPDIIEDSVNTAIQKLKSLGNITHNDIQNIENMRKSIKRGEFKNADTLQHTLKNTLSKNFYDFIEYIVNMEYGCICSLPEVKMTKK